MPAKSFIEIHVDAGRYRDTYWGAFIAWRYQQGENPEMLAKCRGQISGADEITPAEGVAATVALRWLVAALDRGMVSADEPIVLLEDNQAVLGKLRSGSLRGQYTAIWKALADARQSVLKRFTQFEPVGISGRLNRADGLAGPHAEPKFWE